VSLLVAASVLVSSLGVGTPPENVVAGPRMVESALAGHRLAGTATWYRWRIGQAAAGPRLRAALGSHWRGRIVTVSRGTRHVRVRLTDWCRCSWSRVIDLDHRSFDDLMPLWRGVTPVTVSW
jgi:hypothetical protein